MKQKLNDAFKKGQAQITLASGIAFVAFVVSPVATYFTTLRSTDARIAEIKEKTSVLENSIKNTDTNVKEIKEDLKDIKKALNIK